MSEKENPRKTAVKLLCRLEETGAYSNLLLDEHFKRSAMDARDKNFCAALFYGTLERRYTLDEIISVYSDKPNEKRSAVIQNILRTALYQIRYLNGVPDSAAVNEAVKLAAKERNPAAKGFVNALLRAYLRNDKSFGEYRDKARQLAFEYSAPPELVQKWLDEYGADSTRAILSSSLGSPPVTAKVNTLRIEPSKLVKKLKEEGCEARINKYFDDCLDIRVASPESTESFRSGLFHVQDISCRICCGALGAKPDMTVLDMCGSPGGKAFTIAEIMENSGRLLSFDLHKNRVRLIKSGAQRLGLDIITADENDAKLFNSSLPPADAVLCDVPCSGLGVIRRKPEIKYKGLEEFARLPQIQYEILDCSARYVKAGGTLVYSTCTLSRAENDEVMDKFFALHPEFSPAKIAFVNSERASITPDMFDSDGFFIAKAVRTR